ncbi:MAG TPA: Holliday junction branch migration DNA helicase RuvB, partial [Candidatus Dojkabacteria bacterium]|nr:Holliday junction branch migration DNA helicase RuvB [Candidatus Dojkabacteria bacterium]
MIKSNSDSDSGVKEIKRNDKNVSIAAIAAESNENVINDKNIRPNKFSDIIGRESEKKALSMMISSAKKRDEPLDHILFYGPPGLGKTTFAVSIANEVGTSIRVTSGPAIERQGDLAAILTNLKPHEILFIDEIHRLPRAVEEILYPAMEDKVLDIVMGKGPSAKTLRINLEPFTLVGATTQIGKLSSPMRDRFGLVQRLDYFNNDDLVNILVRASNLWGMKYSPESLLSIAQRSRGTARIAIRLLKRVRDFAQSEVG